MLGEEKKELMVLKEEEILAGAKSLKRLEAMASRIKMAGSPQRVVGAFQPLKEGGGPESVPAWPLVEVGRRNSPFPLMPEE